MKHLNLNLIGRFGNQLFAYCWARGYCERNGMTLHTHPWVGQKIFELNDPPWENEYPRLKESDVVNTGSFHESYEGFTVEGYFQNQRSIDYYSRSDAKRWLKWRPSIINVLNRDVSKVYCCGHIRRGDYAEKGYPLISEKSYWDCGSKYGDSVNDEHPHFPMIPISEENPHIKDGFGLPEKLSFLPDFYKMMTCGVLLRANSSFSYWAAVLADDSRRVFSPRIDGKPGGVEVDCEFEEGNHCKLADFDFCSDLHLRP